MTTVARPPLPVLDFSRIGPVVGERFPDVVLPDQHGRAVDLHAARAGRRALVVFHRSASWWPYCKTQLVELQERHGEFERARVAVFAVSYDPVAVLASFAQRYGIAYSLLSDEESRVIRSLGLLNTHIEEQAAHYGATVRDHHQGVPYPGIFVLDERGVIAQKRFEQSYRVRPQAAALLDDRSVPDRAGTGVLASARTHEMAVSASLPQATYRPYQRLDLRLDLVVGPGLHVYGHPVPDGYVPLSAEIDPLESLEVAAPQWPDPRPFRVAGLDARFVIHEGAIRGTVPLFLARNVGEVELVARLRYQACSADECYPPDQVELRLPLHGVDNVRDA